MKFEETPLSGAYIVELEKLEDERGFFGRSWCAKEFAAMGLNTQICQINTSLSVQKGTIRGLHYQVPPHSETKFVRCTQGRIFDVIIDLRRESATYLQWFGIELAAENYRMLYVPERFAHGFLTLEDRTEVFYPVTNYYEGAAEKGIRFDDPCFNIKWPIPVEVHSQKDKAHANFDPMVDGL